MSMKDDYIRALTDELDKANIQYRLEPGTKHNAIIWTSQAGQTLKFFYSRAKIKDGRTIKNACSDIRRMIKNNS